MSIEINPKEFFNQTIELLKENIQVDEGLIVRYTFDLLLVYLNYRPSCNIHHKNNKKGIEITSKDIVKILNKKYPNVFKLFEPIPGIFKTIWCHTKPRNPKNFETKKGTIDNTIYIGEILGYSDPGGEILENPDNHRWRISYELLKIEENLGFRWLGYMLSNLNKVNNKDLINYNNIANNLSDENNHYQVTLILQPQYSYIGLKGWIIQRVKEYTDELKFLNITYNGRKENMKKSIMVKLYDILVNKWYKNKDNSGDIIKLTEEDIKLIKKCYFKIFVFKKQQDDKYLVKVNPKYDNEL